MIYLPKSPAGVREPILLHPLLIVSIYHAARWEEYRPARLNEILVLISQPPGLVPIIRLGILSAAFFKVAFMINPEIGLYPTSGSSCSDDTLAKSDDLVPGSTFTVTLTSKQTGEFYAGRGLDDDTRERITVVYESKPSELVTGAIRSMATPI
ncbi:hypothetical protein MCOR27_003713 [Pyricularia oryzae]|uniref:Uncharacterized protein n=1 Tax=Pyricularia grisea TaxID=148305 RepID=A0ABQ8N9T3_PYRGI|nr:hypothetical protein MCOR01_002445 [Pyricularia oryzae]KAI6293604.1 hypothetical protein MCOR33_009017 [Pyricularia grisea]KAI6259128.1 hypothetical protein MCOR19_004524 [Pyricularia oryzae]KAI6264834.1 hypothetical protein MCOR26_011091 [Pyricularia oryzae]KAI6282481.1 hypothetical protein MCOR27_003713 [Pyricularia oryzae]